MTVSGWPWNMKGTGLLFSDPRSWRGKGLGGNQRSRLQRPELGRPLRGGLEEFVRVRVGFVSEGGDPVWRSLGLLSSELG